MKIHHHYFRLKNDDYDNHIEKKIIYTRQETTCKIRKYHGYILLFFFSLIEHCC